MKLLLLQDAIDSVTDHITPNNKSTLIPYLPYSRADRRFVEGDCLGKSVFLTLIRSVWPTSEVYTIDCHSCAFNKDYIDISVDNLLKNMVIQKIDKPINILFPDLGAKNRYGNILNKMEGINIFFCEKKRDILTGKFLGFTVPQIDKNLQTIIIDDICDGGGTFIGIANELQMSRDLLTLYVTHGIFSKGFDELSKWFSNIITTNSFTKKDLDVPDNMILTIRNIC
jgi:ribose-phosphate pyrophosphokinase